MKKGVFMSIKISQVLFNGNIVDVAIENDRISRIAPVIEGRFDTVIDGYNKLLIPPFYNTHCHGAMTLLRGIADNLELMEWLEKHIWPAENNLTAEAVYIGSKLAILEMIKSGSVFFNDMYFLIWLILFIKVHILSLDNFPQIFFIRMLHRLRCYQFCMFSNSCKPAEKLSANGYFYMNCKFLVRLSL